MLIAEQFTSAHQYLFPVKLVEREVYRSFIIEALLGQVAEIVKVNLAIAVGVNNRDQRNLPQVTIAETAGTRGGEV